MCLQDEKGLPGYENSWVKNQDVVMSSDFLAVSVKNVDQPGCKAWIATDDTIFFPFTMWRKHSFHFGVILSSSILSLEAVNLVKSMNTLEELMEQFPEVAFIYLS